MSDTCTLTKIRVFLATRTIFIDRLALIRKRKVVHQTIARNQGPVRHLIREMGFHAVVDAAVALLRDDVFDPVRGAPALCEELYEALDGARAWEGGVGAEGVTDVGV